MADPTANCPDPEAIDFLRCLATWDLINTDYPDLPYVVVYRCIDDEGNVDEDALDIAHKRYRNRWKPKGEKP